MGAIRCDIRWFQVLGLSVVSSPPTWSNWSSRIRPKNRCMSKIRSRQRTRRSMEIFHQQQFGGRLVILRIEQVVSIRRKAESGRRCARNAGKCFRLAASLAYEPDERATLVRSGRQVIQPGRRNIERSPVSRQAQIPEATHIVGLLAAFERHPANRTALRSKVQPLPVRRFESEDAAVARHLCRRSAGGSDLPNV